MRDPVVDSFSDQALSRRSVLRLLGVGGGSLLLAACGGLGQGKSSSASKQLDFQIPDSAATLPGTEVTLRWMDSGDVKADFFKAFFPAYTRKHPNIKVQYDGTNWNQITQVVTLGFRNGTAPDVFQLPPTITAGQAVANGWIGALDDVVPNWPDLKGRFPPGVFAQGVNVFGGKTYGYPFTSNQRLSNLLLFNQDYMQKAGYDADSKPLTWDEFRAACKKCTEQGAGKYYGLIIGIAQGNALSGTVDYLAEMAGAHGGQFNYKTGEYNFTTDEYIAAVELVLAIKSDGSIFPGSVSLDAPGARGRMPQGLSAMILQGPWNIPIWTRQNPNFHLGLNLPPQSDPKNIWPVTHGPGGSNTWFYSSTTQLGPVVGDIFSYLGSLDGQTMWAHFDGAGDPAVLPDAFAAAQLDPLSAKAVKLAQEHTRLRPDPSVKNPDVFKVFEAQQPVTPNPGATIVGLFTGELQNVKQTMSALKDRMNASLDDAIKVAQQRGAKVSRDDWVYPDWDPKQDYNRLYKSSQ